MLVPATSRNALLGNSATGSRSFNTSYLRLNTAPLITWVDVLPMLTVYPSGADWTTPRLPVAPVTFSMISGCPSDSRIGSLNTRINESVGPPAGNGTITVIGRVG